MSKKKTQKKTLNKLAQKLFELPEEDRKHELAELEIKKGEDYRAKVEFEMNLLKREIVYKKEAEMFYDDFENIGNYPEGFKDFPLIKKEIFRKVNNSKKRQLKKEELRKKRDRNLIEKLLLYRIKHERDKRFSEHFVPKDNRFGKVTAEISMEVDRLFYIWRKLHQQHQRAPDSKSFGLSDEEERILKKIEEGYYDQRMDYDDIKAPKKTKGRETKQSIKKSLFKEKALLKKIGYGNIKKGKERINQLLKSKWYRQDSLTKLEIEVLEKFDYERSGNNRPVFDFSGKKTLVIAYIPGGFKDNTKKGDYRESMQHFSKPYFLKEQIPKTKPEYTIPGQHERVDAAIITSKIKIGIEFQSVVLSKDALTKKIKDIMPYFDIIVLVCNKSDLHYFEKIQDNKRIFVMYNKQFFEDFVPKYKNI